MNKPTMRALELKRRPAAEVAFRIWHPRTRPEEDTDEAWDRMGKFDRETWWLLAVAAHVSLKLDEQHKER